MTVGRDQPRLSTQELDALENMCDLQSLSDTTYCYCDHLTRDDATISNCWVYGDTRPNSTLWDTFHHQKRLHRLTVNLRGDGSLDFVPSRILSYTPQLWMFEIKNANITRVVSEAFTESESVAELRLTSNGIVRLEKHAFNSLTNLTRLNLGKNKITALGRHVFKNLPKLKLLFMDRNEIAKIRSGAFVGLDVLQVLELYDNRLDHLSHGTFRGLKRLERLDLHRNLIESIEDRTFSTLPSLRELDLEGNRIKYISEKGFSGLKNLMRLNLHDNKLLSILPGTFVETPELFFLDLRQNVLDTLEEKTFSPIMDNLKNITMYLFVRDNALHCDCRLAWLLRLRTATASTHVQAALDNTVCHMEGDSLPARLETTVTADPPLETSTLGIGPPVRLVDLKVGAAPLRKLMQLQVGLPRRREVVEKEHGECGQWLVT
ncbi:Connectin [Amphibalanus amphitrite]|uniref:Connectin n=1 Tax=Amphibalanus amphitrite TaxID=1232801 RepID=A0A6A4WG89_AMPAM|nr:Connectin [Amphibalanus amphitrite]